MTDLLQRIRDEFAPAAGWRQPEPDPKGWPPEYFYMGDRKVWIACNPPETYIPALAFAMWKQCMAWGYEIDMNAYQPDRRVLARPRFGDDYFHHYHNDDPATALVLACLECARHRNETGK